MEPSYLRFSIAITVMAVIAMTQTSPCLADEAKEFLDAHNEARAAVGVAPLTWNNTLEGYAKAYAAKRSADCTLVQSDGPYGENIMGGPVELSPVEVVKTWVDEKNFYDYKSNTCVGGGECHHYTVVVSHLTKSLGCARIKCRNGEWFATCNYWPKYDGERPY